MTDYTITRDYWDRPYVTTDGGPLQYVKGRKSPINAEAYTRISTMAGTLDDKEGLLDYTAARAMIGVVKSKAIHARVSHLASAFPDAWKAPEGKAQFRGRQHDGLVAQAKSVGGGDDAADLGTAAHGVWECKDGGRAPEYEPSWMEPWTAARSLALAEFESVLIEPFVVCDEIKTGGNPDRFLRHIPTGVVYAADDKTGDDEPKYPLKVTVQVAIASRSVLYDQTTGQRTPIECDQKWGILIHTPINTSPPRSELYWLDLTKGWELARLSLTVREARTLPKLKKIA